MNKDRLFTFLAFCLCLFLLASCSKSTYKENSEILEATEYFEKNYLQVPQILPIDIRSKAEFESGHISGAISDPHCKSRNFGFFFTFQPVVLVGAENLTTIADCQRKYRRSKLMGGGYQSWVENGYPVAVGKERAVLLKKGCSSLLIHAGNQECL